MIKLPIGVDIDILLDDLRIFSWEASEILLYYAQILKDGKLKSNIIKNDNHNDPVTLADLKVNEKIIQNIKEKYSNVDWKILSEENVKLSIDNSDINSDWIWVLDPLDGTKDFIQGTRNYAMHLALNYKNKPYIGVVLIPEKEELWITNGKNSWCEKKDGSRIKTNLSKKSNLQDMTIVSSKNHRNKNLKQLIQRINFRKVIVMGSIGCKIASILRGESDIYISITLPGRSSPKDWDFAAPDAILRASGGVITDIDNKKLSYLGPDFEQRGVIVASSDINTHKDVCLEIKEILNKYKIYPF